MRAELYVVELRTRGWAVGVSKMPEERVLTTIFRLSKEQKNKLQGLKVRFYRVLERCAVFTLGEKYVVPGRTIPEVEAGFRKIYEDFLRLRREIYEDLVTRWSSIESRLREYAVKVGIRPDEVLRLKPKDEGFLDMYYVVTPLSLTIDQLVNLSEEFEALARERDEYRSLAVRLRNEAQKMLEEVKARYEEKIKELEDVVGALKKALKKKSMEVYRLRLRARELASDAEDVAAFLGEEALEDLRAKLEALKEFFVT